MAKSNNTDSNLSLVELVQQKEKEWREAQDLRVKSLEISLKEQQKLLNNERLRFKKLKEDFQYNLQLLSERDQELERYDQIFAKYKNIESERDGEISELKIRMDDLKSKLLHEVNEREELQKHYQKRMRERQQEMQQFVIAKESEVKKERDNLERFKRELQHQIRTVGEDMETQRHLLMTGYDDELHKREHEYRIKLDEMSNRLLEKDLKVKMLTKEVEILRSYEERTKTELYTTETSVQELEKTLKLKEWELMDKENMNAAQLSDMELKMGQMQASMKKSRAIFEQKQAELDRYARERETALLAAKEAHQQREQQLEETIRENQEKLDTVEVEFRQLEWENKDIMKDKDMKVQRLQKKLAESEERLSSQAAEFSRSSVSKDLELEALRQQEEKLRMDVIQRTEDVERYKKDLSMASERESNLEQAKTQVELDWQRRYEDAERAAYEKQEGLIRNLTRAKDEAVAAVKEKDRQLNQRDNLIRILTETRDQALATLQRHGLSVPMHLPHKEIPGDELEGRELQTNDDEVKELQQQNQNLREVIRQMRQDMEDLNNQLPSRPPSVMVPTLDEEHEQSSVPLTSEYVRSLEKEILDLKSKNRSLNKRLEDLALSHKPPQGTVHGDKQAKILGKIDDPFVQSHVKELNDTIGVLRQDKLHLTAQVRKQEATIAHLQGLVTTTQDQLRQKQVALDQAQYDLTTLTRRTGEESNAQRQRMSELELQLAQVRREADEYFKNGLERNLDATTLGNQLSVLKLELASQGKSTATFNPQTAVINELRDEIQRLRKHPGVSPRSHSDPSIARLQQKLKTAAQRITQLVREKEQLIHMGNKLRAELSRVTSEDMKDSSSVRHVPRHHRPRTPTTPSPVKLTPDEMTDQLQTKLSAMEKLQYALTTHELQVAQRMTEQQKIAAGQVRVTVRSSSSDTSPDSNEPETKEPRHASLQQVSRNPTSPEPALHGQQRSLSQASRKLTSPEPAIHGQQRSLSQVSRKPPPPEPAIHGQQRSSSPYQDHALFTSSSEGQASLQEIWKLLDEEESFRSLSPVKERPRSQTPDHIPAREGSGESDGFTVKGKKTLPEKKGQKEKPRLSKKAQGKMRVIAQKPLVRNYNIQDDKQWKRTGR